MVKLTQCMVCTSGAVPDEQVMAPHMGGAVHLDGAATEGMQQCYVQVRVRPC
jgi:hypothetical protein